MSSKSKLAEDEEERKKRVEEAHHAFSIVMERLEQLLKKGVVLEGDLLNTPVVRGGKNVPKIIGTIERLLAEGHLAGIEDSLAGFCYLTGMGYTRASGEKLGD